MCAFTLPALLCVDACYSRRVKDVETFRPQDHSRAVGFIDWLDRFVLNYGRGGGVGRDRGRGVGRTVGEPAGVGVGEGGKVAVGVGFGVCVAVGVAVGVNVGVGVLPSLGVGTAWHQTSVELSGVPSLP